MAAANDSGMKNSSVLRTSTQKLLSVAWSPTRGTSSRGSEKDDAFRGLAGKKFSNDRWNHEEEIPQDCMYVAGDNRKEAVERSVNFAVTKAIDRFKNLSVPERAKGEKGLILKSMFSVFG
ncbi:hypothetical protein L596_025591 [Steinernema carpocapsae]|uniref:Uncharacterized protein n=1 Tax=Steinernema carpocapsae TaxID=34508 RepID=A0A4U5M873_STECR|nr:hypothetical protein L596_025591 [Steinernema carpocapsae]